MRYGDAFKVLLDDEANRVHNLLIGSVFTVIPVIGPLALAGWHCEIAQRLHRQDTQPIPRLEFADLTTWLGRGVAPFVAGLMASLPMIIIAVMFQIAVVFASLSGSAGIALAVMGVFGLVALAAGLVTAVATMALTTRAELLEDLGPTLQVAPNLDYAKRNFGRMLVAMLVVGLISMPLGMLGMLACCVGILPVQVIVQTAMVHLRVQIYEMHLADGGAPIEK